MRAIKKRNKILSILIVSIFLIIFSAINMGIDFNTPLKNSETTILYQKNPILEPSSVTYNWGSIELISTGSVNDSRDPEIISDSSGNLYVVWDDGNASDPNDRDVFFKLWNKTTSNWENNETVSEDYNLISANPDIALIDKTAFVVWQNMGDDMNSYDILRSIRNPGGSWGSYKNLTINSTEKIKINPSLYIDKAGRPHTVWTEVNKTNSSYYNIYYNKNFLTTERITNYSAEEATNPQVICDSENKPHIVWQEKYVVGIGTSIKIRHIWYDEGWKDIEDISQIGEYITCKDPSIAVDSSGNIHVVWQTHDSTFSSSSINYKVWDKITEEWGSTKTIANIESTEYVFPEIAIDSADNIHIVYGDDPNATLERDLFYINLLSDSIIWSPAQCIANGTKSVWEFSITADIYDKIHIVWEDYSNFNNSGDDSDIFYRRLTLIQRKQNILFLLPSSQAPQIPGYNILILIGAISVISMIIMKKYLKI